MPTSAPGAVRAMVLEAPGEMRLRAFDRPPIGPEEGLLEVELAGICGTDYKIYRGATRYRAPLILGHEVLGRIAELGGSLQQRTGLRVGDRVVVEGVVPCWACRACQTGSYRFCAGGRGYGTMTGSDTPPHLWGAFAEQMYLAPGSVLHRVGDAIPATAAVLAPGVLANGVQWARNKGRVRQGEIVVILGCGPQGLAQAVVAHEAGAELVVMTGRARDRARLELARSFGVDHTVVVDDADPVAVVRELTGGRLADLVIDVAGSPSATAGAADLLRPQGRMVLAGLSGQDAVTPMRMDQLVWKEITVIGVFAQGADAVADAIRLIESGRYPFERIVSHVFPLERAEEAVLASGGALAGVYPTKAAVRPNPGSDGGTGREP